MSIADWFKRHKWLIKEAPGTDERDPDPFHGEQMAVEQPYGVIGNESVSKAADQPTADDIEIG